MDEVQAQEDKDEDEEEKSGQGPSRREPPAPAPRLARPSQPQPDQRHQPRQQKYHRATAHSHQQARASTNPRPSSSSSSSSTLRHAWPSEPSCWRPSAIAPELPCASSQTGGTLAPSQSSCSSSTRPPRRIYGESSIATPRPASPAAKKTTATAHVFALAHGQSGIPC